MKSIIKQIFIGQKGNCDNIKYSEEYYQVLDDTIYAKMN